MKHIITILILAALFPRFASAKDDLGACETLMCMSGAVLSAKGLKPCVPAISRFANIRIYNPSNGKFEPQLTQLARGAYIESCKSGDKTFVRQIVLAYGDREHLNIDLSGISFPN